MPKAGPTIVGVISMLLCPAAMAEEAGGAYAGIYAGFGQTHDSELRIEGYPPGTLLFDPDYRIGGVAGYDFAGPLRAELDIAWRPSGVAGIEAPVVGKISATGKATALSGVVNLLYEPAVEGPLQPHFGAGFGAVRLEIADAVADVPGIGPLAVADGSVTVPAWQFLAGFSWPLSQRVGLTVEYRLLGAIGPEFIGEGSTKVEVGYTDSMLSLGLRAGF